MAWLLTLDIAVGLGFLCYCWRFRKVEQGVHGEGSGVRTEVGGVRTEVADLRREVNAQHRLAVGLIMVSRLSLMASFWLKP
ncbi:TPA: hypothetical protein DCE37_18945 [Candidatus Latescibacteria bacterium]|nr:hypothetical protein [Candidatus Latescibacterota bacterium]